MRGDRDKQRGQPAAPISAMRERARDAAEAIHSDNSCRWFPFRDVFSVYNYLYDYYRGRPEDARLRRIAEEALERLKEVAQRLEENVTNPLPPEWDEAKAALAEAAQVFHAVTQPW